MTLLRDVLMAARSLRRAPAFSLIATFTIALGIGASAALFSVFNAVLLRPLPYADPDRLVLLWTDLRARDVVDFPFSAPDFHEVRERATTLDAVAGVTTFALALTGDDGAPEQVQVAGTTPNIFDVLGARIIHGRGFEADDAAPLPPPAPDATAPAPPPPPVAVVLGFGMWQRRYGGDPNVVGRIVRLGQNDARVIGVLEPDVELLFPPGIAIERRPDFWAAQRINFATAPRDNHFLRAIGRLQPNATHAALQAQLDALAAELRAAHTIKAGANLHIRATPMHEDLVADVRPALLALMGAVLFVLLIACANVANLLLVRSASRERELSVRAALGGSRARLVRQMLIEALVIACAGTVLGVLLADAGVTLLLALQPPDLPRIDLVSIDLRVLAFAAGSALLAAAIFGVLPALRASRPDVAGMLRESGRSAAGLARGRALRSGVVVAEVALCFVLLVGSGLMLRSFAALHRIDPGFEPTGVLTFRAPPREGGEEARVYIDAVRDRIGALPGVRSISAANPLPLDGQTQNGRWGLADAETDPDRFMQADMRFVLPRYFETMRTPLLAGRDFDDADNVATSQAIIIDDVLARKAFGSERDAIGRSILSRLTTPEPEWFEVVGVVAHQRHASLAAVGRETIYFPASRLNVAAANRWIVRADGDPLALLPAIRAEIAAIDPLVPMADMQTLPQIVAASVSSTRFALTLIATFAFLAVALAGVGLYGVLTTVVRQRTSEVGVRMAFGAEPGAIYRLVVGEGLRLSAAGLILGLLGSLLLTRAIAGLLVGVQPTDPLTYAVMALLFMSVAALASWLPARRAAALDPVHALRE